MVEEILESCQIPPIKSDKISILELYHSDKRVRQSLKMKEISVGNEWLCSSWL